jgi:hypothetical protein
MIQRHPSIQAQVQPVSLEGAHALFLRAIALMRVPMRKIPICSMRVQRSISHHPLEDCSRGMLQPTPIKRWLTPEPAPKKTRCYAIQEAQNEGWHSTTAPTPKSGWGVIRGPRQSDKNHSRLSVPIVSPNTRNVKLLSFYSNTTVLFPYSKTRFSTCQRTARESTTFSRSRPF